MTNTAYRQAYNKLQANRRREQAEALRRFKEANPERYAELLKKVQTEPESTTPIPSNTQTLKHAFDVDKFLREFANGRKDYFINIEIPHEGWTEEHTLFEMLSAPTDEEVNKNLARRHPNYIGAKIKSIEQCSCPRCR